MKKNTPVCNELLTEMKVGTSRISAHGVPVFSSGKIIGFVDEDIFEDIPEDITTATLKPVTMEVKVLFWPGLNRGLLVPVEIAEKMESTVKKAEEDMAKFSEAVKKVASNPVPDFHDEEVSVSFVPPKEGEKE